MEFKDIHAVLFDFEVDGVKHSVYTHDSFIDPSKHLARLFIGECEVSIEGDNRGHAMLELAEHLSKVAATLKMMAFEQEGALPARVLNGDREPRRAQ